MNNPFLPDAAQPLHGKISAKEGSRSVSRPSGSRRRPRVPGESNPRPRPHRLLGHAITSPQKRTLKRIEALRGGLFDGGFAMDDVKARILSLLVDDRELRVSVPRPQLEQLAFALVDGNNSEFNTAELIGGFLRNLGAMQRPELNAPRVKQALRVLNEVLFADAQDGAVAQGVREFKLEKRDGGLQIVAVLRRGASFDAVRADAKTVLAKNALTDIDIRIESR
jgi:hypothetical protein